MKLYEGLGRMTNAEYIEIARKDATWREIAASWAIEGIQMTEANEVIAGRMIVGEIDLAEAVRLIRSNAGVQVQAHELPISDTLN